jgi:hypothetical protein
MFKLLKNLGLSLVLTALVPLSVSALSSAPDASVTQTIFSVNAEPQDRNVRIMEIEVKPWSSNAGALEVENIAISCDYAESLTFAYVRNNNRQVGQSTFDSYTGKQVAVIDISDTMVTSTGSETFEILVDVSSSDANYRANCRLKAIAVDLLMYERSAYLDYDTVGENNYLTVKSEKLRDVNFFEYGKAIEWMYEEGFANGYRDGSFRPDACVNRAEFLKMLMLASGTNVENYGNKSWFYDVDYNAWYAKYLNAAVAKGVVRGYPDGSFRPQVCVNRAEAIKMASVELFGNHLVMNAGYQRPYDVYASSWYAPFVDFALSSNTVGRNHMRADGNGSTYFMPEKSMTRGEVAEMLYRMSVMHDNGLKYYDDRYYPRSA